MSYVSVNLVCWNTPGAPGPEIDRTLQFAAVPREGEQIEIDDDLLGEDVGVLYVHRVRHVHQPNISPSEGRFVVVVEVTDRHPGTR